MQEVAKDSSNLLGIYLAPRCGEMIGIGKHRRIIRRKIIRSLNEWNRLFGSQLAKFRL